MTSFFLFQITCSEHSKTKGESVAISKTDFSCFVEGDIKNENFWSFQYKKCLIRNDDMKAILICISFQYLAYSTSNDTSSRSYMRTPFKKLSFSFIFSYRSSCFHAYGNNPNSNWQIGRIRVHFPSMAQKKRWPFVLSWVGILKVTQNLPFFSLVIFDKTPLNGNFWK